MGDLCLSVLRCLVTEAEADAGSWMGASRWTTEDWYTFLRLAEVSHSSTPFAYIQDGCEWTPAYSGWKGAWFPWLHAPHILHTQTNSKYIMCLFCWQCIHITHDMWVLCVWSYTDVHVIVWDRLNNSSELFLSQKYLPIKHSLQAASSKP